MLIERYAVDHVEEVGAFNQRLLARGSAFQFRANPTGGASLETHVNNIRSEHYLVLDRKTVRGAYTLIRQNAWIGGRVEEVAFLQLPLSEGSVDPAFGAVGLLILKDALRRAPLLFGLGMGGIERPLPRLFRALGARLFEVPFYFAIVRPNAFLRNATALRASPSRRWLANIAAQSGVGHVAIATLNRVRNKSRSQLRAIHVDDVAAFPEAISALWAAEAHRFSFCSMKDHETLNFLYPSSDRRFHRLLVYKDEVLVGWSLVTVSQLRGHNHFGDMKVGAIANCLSKSGEEAAVVAGAAAFLRQTGVDLIVSNQSYGPWGQALLRDSFTRFRSNFVFAAAGELGKRLQTIDPTFQLVHVNRGDGDGPYNL